MHYARKILAAATGAAAVLAVAGAAASPASAAAAATAPLPVTLSASGTGASAVFAQPAGTDGVNLTVGSPSATTYAQMVVNSTGLAPSTAPSFTTDSYAAGSPRWVIQLGNGDTLFSNQTGVAGAANGWMYNDGHGWQGYGDTYAEALAVVDSNGLVPVKSAFIVADGDQAPGTTDHLTNIQYDGMSPVTPAVTITNPGTQSSPANVPVSLQISASTSYAPDSTLTYSIGGSAAAWLKINSSTGLITGTPTAVENTQAVKVTVTDSVGDSSHIWFAWDVTPAQVPDTVAVTYACGLNLHEYRWNVVVTGSFTAKVNFFGVTAGRQSWDGSVYLRPGRADYVTTRRFWDLRVYWDADGSQPAPREVGALVTTTGAPAPAQRHAC